MFPFARDLLKAGSKVIHNRVANIILGVFPFARDLLKAGSKVIHKSMADNILRAVVGF